MEDFSRRFQRPPDRLGPQHIREYQAELFKEPRGESWQSPALCIAALRFFNAKTLKKGWSAAETLYPKIAEHVPSILSQEEVPRLINAADTSFHRTLLMTLYATGVRVMFVTSTFAILVRLGQTNNVHRYSSDQKERGAECNQTKPDPLE